MIAEILVLTVVALVSPQVFPGVTVKNASTAALVALIFVLLNLAIGWFLHFVLGLVSLPLIVLTLGLFALVVIATVNALLLKLTDSVLDTFEIRGWWPAFGMGFLFALGSKLTDFLTR